MPPPSTQQSEYVQYITPDSVVYDLHAPGVRVVVHEDMTGMPPIEYLTQRGPFQHGESLKGFFFRPRIVEVLIRFNYCSRTDYWRGRGDILRHLNPGRQSFNQLNTGRLRRITSTGEMRDLNCLVQEGPSFSPHDTGVWDEWSFTDVLRFIGFDPIYFNPAVQSATRTFGPADQLQFPITFPIQFTQLQPITLTYAGDWITYPTITVPGPTNNPRIENITTGDFIKVNYVVPVGSTMTISLGYGAKTVTLQDGTNLFGYVDPTSDLTTFAIYPHPAATNGVNLIKAFDAGSGAGVPFTISWYNRYVGLGL